MWESFRPLTVLDVAVVLVVLGARALALSVLLSFLPVAVVDSTIGECGAALTMRFPVLTLAFVLQQTGHTIRMTTPDNRSSTGKRVCDCIDAVSIFSSSDTRPRNLTTHSVTVSVHVSPLRNLCWTKQCLYESFAALCLVHFSVCECLYIWPCTSLEANRPKDSSLSPFALLRLAYKGCMSVSERHCCGIDF
jgi:hypothetical protein